MKRTLFLCGVATLLATSTADAAAPQVFRYYAGSEPESIDPPLTTTVDASDISSQLFEGLVTPDPQKINSVLPGVAERWTISRDGKTYTFYLRKNATWSDGSRVTADDFVYGWRRALDPKTASPQSSRYSYVKNAQAFLSKKLSDVKTVGFKALDAATFQVELEEPFPPFLSLITKPTFAPGKKVVVEQFGDQWTKPEHIVTNGPFLLKEARINDRIIMVKNPGYWDAKNVHLDQLDAVFVDDLETALKRYESGELEYVQKVPPTKAATLLSRPDFHFAPAFALYFYVFNTKDPAVSDPRVRRALALAVDQDTLVQKVLRTKDIPAHGIMPPGIPGYPTKQRIVFDPKRARELLAEAGFPAGKGFPPMTLSYNTLESHRTIAETIQQMWKKNLGIDVQIQNLEWRVHIANLQNHHFQIARIGGFGEYIYPTTFMEQWLSWTAGNYSDWTDPEYEKLWKEASETADLKKRLAIYDKMEDMVMAAMPEIPLYFYANQWMLKPSVKGFTVTPTLEYVFKGVSIK